MFVHLVVVTKRSRITKKRGCDAVYKRNHLIRSGDNVILLLLKSNCKAQVIMPYGSKKLKPLLTPKHEVELTWSTSLFGMLHYVSGQIKLSG